MNIYWTSIIKPIIVGWKSDLSWSADFIDLCLYITSDETENSREQMYVDQLREYKFYLAFENNYCEDYHTEKIFSALKTEDVIPGLVTNTIL